MLLKPCSQCRITKQIKFFWKNKYQPDGYSKVCSSCMKKAKAKGQRILDTRK